MKVFYGVTDKYREVTHLVDGEEYIEIPAGDQARAMIFGDHLPNILKHILVIRDDGKKIIYDDTEYVLINKSEKDFVNPKQKLEEIHKKTVLIGGDIKEEYPEQLMSVTFLSPNSKVLELGSNIGRNSIVISNILNNHENLVTLEPDENICAILLKNKKINDLGFRIINSALSYRPLVMKGWNSQPISGEVSPGFKEIKTITFEEIESSQNITFDTLVVDCEGALFYILSDKPDILNNINTIIMENDYLDIKQKNKVDEVIVSKNFKLKHKLSGGWGPCYNNFYEVWQK